MNDIENDFKMTFASWKTTKSKKDWDHLFILVQDCCYNVAKKNCAGKSIPKIDTEGTTKIEERALDAACRVMKRFSLGYEPNGKLATFCWPWVKYYCFYNKKNIQEDQEEFYDPDFILDKENIENEQKTEAHY